MEVLNNCELSLGIVLFSLVSACWSSGDVCSNSFICGNSSVCSYGFVCGSNFSCVSTTLAKGLGILLLLSLRFDKSLILSFLLLLVGSGGIAAFLDWLGLVRRLVLCLVCTDLFLSEDLSSLLRDKESM